jgi:uncharacterized membrane protein (Fun14 family)
MPDQFVIAARMGRGAWVQPVVRTLIALFLATVIVYSAMGAVVASMPATAAKGGTWAEQLAGRLFWTGMLASLGSGVVAGLVCSVRLQRAARMRAAQTYSASLLVLAVVTVVALGWHWTGGLSLLLQCAPCAVICASPWGDRGRGRANS